MSRPSFFTFFLLLSVLSLFGLPASGQREVQERPYERILSFDSDITVEPDGALLVREDIQVQALGIRIRRGISRGLQTRYVDDWTGPTRVEVAVVRVERDGALEPYQLGYLDYGILVSIGDERVTLPPGIYTYTLIYRTRRHLRHSNQLDQLNWNVAGLGRELSIDRATALVRLPGSIPAERVRSSVYTGSSGLRGRDYTAEVKSDGAFFFASTSPIRPEENLTIEVAWPRGAVARPTFGQRARFFFSDHSSALFGLLGLLGVGFYYYWVWLHIGKDPPSRSVSVAYEPPKGLSPAGMRFLKRMKYDQKTFAAVVLSLAVRKSLSIRERLDGTFTLIRQPDAPGKLSSEEQTAMEHLFANHREVTLDGQNSMPVYRAMKAVGAALTSSQEGVYFQRNRQYVFLGALLSMGLMVFASYTTPGGPMERLSAVMICIFALTIAGFLSLFFLLPLSFWRKARVRSLYLLPAVLTFIFMLPFVHFGLKILWGLGMTTSMGLPIVVAAVVAMNVAFYSWLKAPTPVGQKLRDQIAGFERFLSAVDADRLQRMHPGDGPPELFERYLPYVLALDVENTWVEQFADVLSGATAGRTRGFSSDWYSATGREGFGSAESVSSFGRAFSDALARGAAPPPLGSAGGGEESGSGG